MEFGNMEFKYLIAIPLDIIKFEINGNLLRSFSVFGSTKKIRKKQRRSVANLKRFSPNIDFRSMKTMLSKYNIRLYKLEVKKFELKEHVFDRFFTSRYQRVDMTSVLTLQFRFDNKRGVRGQRDRTQVRFRFELDTFEICQECPIKTKYITNKNPNRFRKRNH